PMPLFESLGDRVGHRVLVPLDREQVVVAIEGERYVRTDRVTAPQELVGLRDDGRRRTSCGTITGRHGAALPRGQRRPRRHRCARPDARSTAAGANGDGRQRGRPCRAIAVELDVDMIRVGIGTGIGAVPSAGSPTPPLRTVPDDVLDSEPLRVLYQPVGDRTPGGAVRAPPEGRDHDVERPPAPVDRHLWGVGGFGPTAQPADVAYAGKVRADEGA